MKIKLSTQEEVLDFVTTCSKCKWDINVYDGRNVVDGKSIVGMLNIGLGKELKVCVVCDDEEDGGSADNFFKNIRKYEVEQYEKGYDSSRDNEKSNHSNR